MFRKSQVNDIFKLVKHHHKDINCTCSYNITPVQQERVLKYDAGVKSNPLFIVGKHSINWTTSPAMIFNVQTD